MELFDEGGSASASATRTQFRYISIDEYQDTNRPQYLLVAAARVGPRQPRRRRRPRPVDLQVARRGYQEHPRLRARLPEVADRAARAELPLDAGDPRRGVRGDPPEPPAQGQEALDRPQRRREDRLHAHAGRARGGGLRAAHDPRPARRRHEEHHRGALPHERPVARDRRRADARRPAVPDGRRRAVLRAQRGQGRARVSQADHQPARRRQLPPRGQRPHARHRQGRDGRAGRRRSVDRRRGRAAVHGRRPVRPGGRSPLAVGQGAARARQQGRDAARARVAQGVRRDHHRRAAARRRPHRLGDHRAGDGEVRLLRGPARREVGGGRRAPREPGRARLRRARVPSCASRMPRSAASSIACRCCPRPTSRPARRTPASG